MILPHDGLRGLQESLILEQEAENLLFVNSS